MDIKFIVITMFLMIADGFTVRGPSGPLFVPLGSSVVLPCYVDELLLMEGLEVEWRRTDSETLVHLYQDGESRPEAQRQDYHDRAHFFIDQIQHGNFSLRLDNLRAEDEGKYTCKVHSQQDSGETEVQIKDVECLPVSGSNQPVSAYDGEDVTLNCSVDSHITPEHIEEVSWIKTDEDGDILVLLYQNKKTSTDSSDEQYRDRVEFFTDEIPKGNFSLRLKSVRTEDKGVYMCQVFAGGLSASATVVLERLGFSLLHITVLVFCFVAGPGAVLLLCCLIYCRSKNTVSRSTIWNLQLSLVFFPNICMSIAFFLWGLTEGFLHETVTCCALYILRPVMLIWALPYLKYLQDNIKTWNRCIRITSEFVVFTVIVYSVLFAYGWRKSAHDTFIEPGSGLYFVIVVLNRMAFGLSFVNIVQSCLLLSAIDFEKWISWVFFNTCMFPEFFNVIIILLRLLNKLNSSCQLSKFKFEFKLLCQEWIRRAFSCCKTWIRAAFSCCKTWIRAAFSCCKTWIRGACFSCCNPWIRAAFSCCKTWIRAAFSCFKTNVFFMEIFLLSLSQLSQLIFSFGLPSLALLFMPFLQALLLIGLQVVPLLQSKFKFLCQRWITLLWMITITLLDIVLVIYIHLTILEREKEYVGWTCVIVFIEVLKMIVCFDNRVPEAKRSKVQKRRQQTETSQQASNALHLCHEIMYMFGAVGLVLLNSVTLTAELILKARNGERILKDLRVIVFPSECVFALYWLGLQMHGFWKIVTTESTRNQRNTHQRHRRQLRNTVSEIYKRKNRSAPYSAVSQNTVSEIYKRKNQSAPYFAVSQKTVSEIYKRKNRSAPYSAVSQKTVSEIYKKKNQSAPESAVSQTQ
ncbi:uncharacterized protein LOC127509449 isoform X5 [Ctenopharyngodon idella]|uniref:uncharacterized protein LOC127509449 isoform X3 n=1 Tax=Ctenopharyngodon idella TaxID=7959 RepID=UPI00222EFE85|nr:uncharacterized protein LOC127509449 isoform X3 [Ctenopharyngodon idella]XP_051744133.1 uncharacterized protein LOC127509449 isoform X4 [Ctenopharyngodon idella]XP_051744134.1 uncharacterized protein LOC127509449 isoform X5 [Ctenopharyngodon idella]